MAVVARMRGWMTSKMASLNDGFEESLYYRDNWVSEDRRIVRSGTMEPGGPA
jgi:hypothetical protein